MPTYSTRIQPIPTSQFTDAQAAVFGGGHGDPNNELNLVKTLVQHLDLYKRYIPFAAGLVGQSAFTPRHREIITCRTLALVQETYEAAAHIAMSAGAGLSDAEAKAARDGGPGLPPFETALVRGTEELVKQQRLTDATWATLSQQYSKEQMIELHFLVGNYVLMATISKGLGIQVEEAGSAAWKPPT